MFGVFAAGCFLTFLATAPPHLTRVFGLVLATGPIEVLFFVVLIGALLASLQATSEVSFLRKQFRNSFFQFFPFLVQGFNHSCRRLQLLSQADNLSLECSQNLIYSYKLVLIGLGRDGALTINHYFDSVQFLCLISERISLRL